MNKKMLYEQPQVNVFTVQTEGVICQSQPDGIKSITGDNVLDDSSSWM